MAKLVHEFVDVYTRANILLDIFSIQDVTVCIKIVFLNVFENDQK